MSYQLPGESSRALLARGMPYLRDGLRYRSASEKSAARGYAPPAQFIVGRAEGDYVWDLDGNRYIDFQNGWASNPLGNCHPEVIEAVHQALLRYGFQWEHPLRIPLAEKLAERMPAQALPRFSFEVSGTEAAESAVHLALCHTRRRYIISFTSSFHGEALGTKMVSAYGSENNLYMEAWAGGALKAPYPHSEHIPAGMSEEQYVEYCLWYIDTHLPEYVVPEENIAAVMIEPGLAEGGNWIPTPAFLTGIRRICDSHGWLMIADEVLTGLGRTGRMWSVEHYDVVPDILVAGKNLSGGIEACAGVAARDAILGDNPRASAGSTFAGTPAGCAARPENPRNLRTRRHRGRGRASRPGRREAQWPAGSPAIRSSARCAPWDCSSAPRSMPRRGKRTNTSAARCATRCSSAASGRSARTNGRSGSIRP